MISDGTNLDTITCNIYKFELPVKKKKEKRITYLIRLSILVWEKHQPKVGLMESQIHSGSSAQHNWT